VASRTQIPQQRVLGVRERFVHSYRAWEGDFALRQRLRRDAESQSLVEFKLREDLTVDQELHSPQLFQLSNLQPFLQPEEQMSAICDGHGWTENPHRPRDLHNHVSLHTP
jgi:hypothetical protein